MVSFSISRLGFSLLRGLTVLERHAKRTELATHFLHRSDKLVFGPLVLLAPERTVANRALYRRSRRRVPRQTSTRAPRLCRWLAPGR